MVINVFKAMQYPEDDDAGNCMRIDALDMLIEEKNENATLEEKQKSELKPLPKTLKYAFLGDDQELPVIISSSLTTKQEDELLM
ncbi:hypothetical protein PIB30_102545, partial [Stylosanthes scabra]|nr:hypothetical protein [Stylosanthes scabra]